MRGIPRRTHYNSVAENPKSYDQAFKSISDADPRGLLGIFGVLPMGIKAEVEPLPRELSMRPLEIDSGYMVRRAGRKPYIVLFEALTSWKAAIAERLAWYGAFLGHKYSVAVHVYCVPLTKDSCPASVPVLGRARRGGVTVTARLNWVKPWQIDAQEVLDLESAELDAWAILFDASEEQTAETLRRVSRNRERAPLLRMLIGLRYRRREEECGALFERIASMIRPEIWRESLAVQEWLDEGRVEGRVEGRAEGAAATAKELLLETLALKFPKWRTPASLDSIGDAEVLKRLFRKASATSNKADMRRAIDNAAKGLEF